MRAAGDYYQPDHWPGYTFPKGQGRLPVVGVRTSAALAFCEWLSQHDPTALLSSWRYRLPNRGELDSYNLLKMELPGHVRGAIRPRPREHARWRLRASASSGSR